MIRVAVKRCCGGEQRVVVNGIVFVHVDLSGGFEQFRGEDRFGRKQAQAGHNHKSVGRLASTSAESGRVGHFPSEIQTADEAVDFAECGGASAEFEGELEIGFVAGEDGIAASTGFCGREEKDTGRRCGQMKPKSSL